jgi:hypothetical protein
MARPSRQFLVLSITLVLAAAVSVYVAFSRRGPVEITFWFEPISEDVRRSVPDRLSPGISERDLAVIETTAREEVVRAFREFPVVLSTDRVETYRVRVVGLLENAVAGASAESHLIAGLGGQGFVNFQLHAHGAVTYAPPGASRDDIVEGIGRGIGRAAVHEFAHQLLGHGTAIDDSEDVQSYEYGSAVRQEQYYGPVRWDIAAPMLRDRFGLAHDDRLP